MTDNIRIRCKRREPSRKAVAAQRLVFPAQASWFKLRASMFKLQAIFALASSRGLCAERHCCRTWLWRSTSTELPCPPAVGLAISALPSTLSPETETVVQGFEASTSAGDVLSNPYHLVQLPNLESNVEIMRRSGASQIQTNHECHSACRVMLLFCFLFLSNARLCWSNSIMSPLCFLTTFHHLCAYTDGASSIAFAPLVSGIPLKFRQPCEIMPLL